MEDSCLMGELKVGGPQANLFHGPFPFLKGIHLGQCAGGQGVGVGGGGTRVVSCLPQVASLP